VENVRALPDEFAALTAKLRLQEEELHQREDELRLREKALQFREAELDLVSSVQGSQLRARELVEYAPDGFIVTNEHGIIHEVNQAACAYFGGSKTFVLHKPLAMFVADSLHPALYALVNRLRFGQEQHALTWQVRLKPYRGDARDVAVTVFPTHSPHGAGRSFTWLLRDATQRMETERALFVERHFNERLIDAAQAIILVVDGGGHILRSNRFSHEVLGPPERLAKRVWYKLLRDPAHQEEASNLMHDALLNGSGRGGIWAVNEGAVQRAISWSLRALIGDGGQRSFLVLGYDVTEQLAAQKRALEAERLAAIGMMVAGLAHESRNALQRTLACLERLRFRLEHQAEALDLVERAQQAQEQLARLFEDLRSFAAPMRLHVEDGIIADLWREAWQEVCASHPDKRATLAEGFEEHPHRCAADRFRMIQVFRNLFDNAFAACEGEVKVHIDVTDLDQGRALCIHIRDHGPGMSDEARQHLFEPFFSTRMRGTGLGMTIARRIVEAHGGELTLVSTSPAGTEFSIILPRSTP
jgi:PAS domain S-box-containing protein